MFFDTDCWLVNNSTILKRLRSLASNRQRSWNKRERERWDVELAVHIVIESVNERSNGTTARARIQSNTTSTEFKAGALVEWSQTNQIKRRLFRVPPWQSAPWQPVSAVGRLTCVYLLLLTMQILITVRWMSNWWHGLNSSGVMMPPLCHVIHWGGRQASSPSILAPNETSPLTASRHRHL
jgi:hypothetical protein